MSLGIGIFGDLFFLLCCNFPHDNKQASAGPRSLKYVSAKFLLKSVSYI